MICSVLGCMFLILPVLCLHCHHLRQTSPLACFSALSRISFVVSPPAPITNYICFHVLSQIREATTPGSWFLGSNRDLFLKKICGRVNWMCQQSPVGSGLCHFKKGTTTCLVWGCKEREYEQMQKKGREGVKDKKT